MSLKKNKKNKIDKNGRHKSKRLRRKIYESEKEEDSGIFILTNPDTNRNLVQPGPVDLAVNSTVVFVKALKGTAVNVTAVHGTVRNNSTDIKKGD